MICYTGNCQRNAYLTMSDNYNDILRKMLRKIIRINR